MSLAAILLLLLRVHFSAPITSTRPQSHFTLHNSDGSHYAVPFSSGVESPVPLKRKRRDVLSRRYIPTKRDVTSTSHGANNLPKPQSMPGLILAHGYPAEVHHVTTEDGYILELHRIPGPRMVDTSPKKKKRDRKTARNKWAAIREFGSKNKRGAPLRSSETSINVRYRNKRSLHVKKKHDFFHNHELDIEVTGNKDLYDIIADVTTVDKLSESDFNVFEELFSGYDSLGEFMKNNPTSKTNNNKFPSNKIRERRKRSDARIQLARNREMIRSMDPRILIHRTLRERRRNARMFRDVNSRTRSVEVNAKRSISEKNLALERSDNDGNSQPVSSFKCSDLANKCSDQIVFEDESGESVNNKMLACEKLRACINKNSRKIHSLGSNLKELYYPQGELLINNKDGSINYLNNEIRIQTTNSTAKQIAQPKSKKKIVFIQHCLQCSSADFVLNDHNQALGFILADAGYDVWLGNFRGNQYSKGHTTLSTRDVKYWKFTVDDLAKYDLPSMVDYVLKVTRQEDLYYIGHSLGTLTFFMASSTNPVFMSKIRLMIGLAPSGYLDNMRGGLKVIVKSAQSFYRVMEAIGVGELGGVLPWRGEMMRRFCKPRSPLVGICAALLPSLNGRNQGLHDKEYLPLVLANFPSGTSFRLMAQIGQIVGSDGLRKFNFGSDRENIEHYGSVIPPHYPLQNITCPVAIMWSDNDIIVTPQDVARIAKRLPNIVLNYRVPLDIFNHVDFLFADQARQLVYEPIMELLPNY